MPAFHTALNASPSATLWSLNSTCHMHRAICVVILWRWQQSNTKCTVSASFWKRVTLRGGAYSCACGRACAIRFVVFQRDPPPQPFLMNVIHIARLFPPFKSQLQYNRTCCNSNWPWCPPLRRGCSPLSLLRERLLAPAASYITRAFECEAALRGVGGVTPEGQKDLRGHCRRSKG
jgi:hypothetical protein